MKEDSLGLHAGFSFTVIWEMSGVGVGSEGARVCWWLAGVISAQHLWGKYPINRQQEAFVCFMFFLGGEANLAASLRFNSNMLLTGLYLKYLRGLFEQNKLLSRFKKKNLKWKTMTDCFTFFCFYLRYSFEERSRHKGIVLPPQTMLHYLSEQSH